MKFHRHLLPSHSQWAATTTLFVSCCPPPSVALLRFSYLWFSVASRRFCRTLLSCLMVATSLGRLPSSMGRSQSRVIVEVVAPVALLPGIALSPGIIVRYGRLVEKSWPRFGPPSLVLLGLFLSCLVFRSRRSVTAIYTLPGGSLVLPSPQAHPPLVAPRSVASSYCTVSVAQVGLGLDVMSVGLLGFCPWLFKAAYRPLSLLYLVFIMGFQEFLLCLFGTRLRFSFCFLPTCLIYFFTCALVSL